MHTSNSWPPTSASPYSRSCVSPTSILLPTSLPLPTISLLPPSFPFLSSTPYTSSSLLHIGKCYYRIGICLECIGVHAQRHFPSPLGLPSCIDIMFYQVFYCLCRWVLLHITLTLLHITFDIQIIFISWVEVRFYLLMNYYYYHYFLTY